MAQTLEEFLINVRYNIDTPSQQTFFDSMKRAATSVAGVAGEMTALSLAILKISEHMATAGEKLYWMSQRVGDSVTSIQSFAFAMSNLGVSAGDATAGIERFGAWTRNMGPAATGYLRSLGVTATDTVGRMKELGAYFRTHGGTAAQQGTIEYSIALRQAGMMNVDERTMLALSSGQMERGLQEAGMMQRLVWGKDWQSGPSRFAAQSVQVMNQFRSMGLFFDTLNQKFGLSLFKVITPELETINKQLHEMLPSIQAFLDHLISYAPLAMHFLEGIMKAFGFLLDLANSAMTTFDKLPAHVDAMIGAILLAGPALRLLGSPIFWLISGITALLLLMDDYRGYLDDLKHPGEKPTAFLPWDKIGTMAAPFLEMGKGADEFIEKWTGIQHGVEWMIAIGIAGLLGGFGKLAGVVAGIAGVFWGPFGIILGITAAMAGLKLTGMLEEQLRNEAAAAGYKLIPGDPSIGQSDMWLDPNGKPISQEEMAKRLGHKFGYVTPMELDPKLKEQYGPPLPTYEDFPDPTKSYDSHLPNPFPGRPSAGGQSDWSGWRRWFRGPTSISPGSGGTGRPGMGAGYQLASFGGDGRDEYFTPERFYVLFLASFADNSEKLGDILTTLMAMATHQGVNPANLPGGGEGGATMGTGPAMTGPEQVAMRDFYMKRLGLSAEAASGIVNNVMAESGGRPDAVSSSGARGGPQWIPSRWKPLAAWATAHGFDPNTRAGQMEMLAHDMEQNFPGLLAEMRRGGSAGEMATKFFETFEAGHYAPLLTPGNYRTHTRGADQLSHLPLGADGAAASAPASRGGGAADPFRGITQNNSTSISVTAPSPASAAAQTVEAQNRVFEHHIRYAKGTLLA